MRTFLRRTPALLAVLLGLAACGGGGDGTDGVASLGGDGTTTTAVDGGGGGSGGGGKGDSEFQDAMLEFAQCMRDEGIVDFPDPEVGEGGVVAMGGPDEGPVSDTDIAELEAAQEACSPIIEEARGSMPLPSPEEQAEMQDEVLAFSECMREHGIDFPDPVFSEDGASLSLDRNDVDPQDPDFQAAQEDCGGKGGFRVGGPSNDAASDEAD